VSMLVPEYTATHTATAAITEQVFGTTDHLRRYP
jgi:hypothetical protein